MYIRKSAVDSLSKKKFIADLEVRALFDKSDKTICVAAEML